MATDASKAGTRSPDGPGHYVLGQYVGFEAGDPYESKRDKQTYIPVQVKVIAGSEMILIRFQKGEPQMKRVLGDHLAPLAPVRVKVYVRAFAFSGQPPQVRYEAAE